MKKIYFLWIVLLIVLPGLPTTCIMAQANIVVKGKVTAVDGPIPGVSVLLKGTQRGVTTGSDGTYAISIPEDNSVLVFSFVGFSPQEIVVGNRTVVDVVLMADSRTLGEVVVVGYGEQSRKNLTSSISTVKGDDMNRGAISDLGQLLQGKVPGLNITRSGDPNRTAAIILRGASTLRDGAQSPLFVIDGVIGADISLLAPDDIVSIEVLKDASATAIYGNRAANGVIMVSTRRPVKGATQVSYSGYLGIDKISRQYKMMDANQLRTYLSNNNQSLDPADDLGANTNWQDEVQRSTAVSQNHNIFIDGGTDKTLYSASVNYYDQQGIIKSSELQRVIARISVEQKAIRDKLKLGLNITNSLSDATLVPYRNTVLSQMITYLPTVPVKNDAGVFYDNATRLGQNYFNPASMIANGKERNRYNTFLGALSAQVKLPLGFTYDVRMSYQQNQNNFNAYYNSYFTTNYNSVRNTPEPPAPPVFLNLTGRNGQATRNTYQNTAKILETFLTWDREFGNHSIRAVLGYSWQENINGDGFQATSTNFPVDDVGYNNLGLGNPYAVSSFRVDFGPDLYQQVRLISDFARLNYNYDNRYLLQLSLRRDGSSMFGRNEQWGYFPSAGFGWRISEEAFMQEQRLFSDLKLRGSYGVTGNSQGFSALTSKLIYGNVDSFFYNGNMAAAFGAIQNENPDLKWEKTATQNAGLDFGLWDGRISGSFDLYDKKTTDLIWTYSVDPFKYPYPYITDNVGTMSNRGVELSLTADVFRDRPLSWTSTVTLAHNKNKIVSLSNATLKTDSVLLVSPDGGGQTGETVQMIAQGMPLGEFYTYAYAGKNENGVSQYTAKNGQLTTTPQRVRDYKPAGNAQPKLLLGWTNTLRYRNVDLTVFFRAVLGNKIMNVTRADLFRPTTARLNNIPEEVANESIDDVNSYKYSSRFVENGGYVRLDNATLGYHFTRLGQDIKKLRIYTSVNNLFVITNYKGIDPEINQGGQAPGVDARNFYPKTRTFLIGINVSF